MCQSCSNQRFSFTPASLAFQSFISCVAKLFLQVILAYPSAQKRDVRETSRVRRGMPTEPLLPSGWTLGPAGRLVIGDVSPY